MPTGGTPNLLAGELSVPIKTSYTSASFRLGATLSLSIGLDGRAVICGIKSPLDNFEPTLFKPSTSLNSSSAVGALEERGRSSFASSVARARKVESGSVTPSASWIRFWTEMTEEREIGMATSVSTGSGSAGSGASLLGGSFVSFGGAALMLLRSKLPSFVIRADCSEE